MLTRISRTIALSLRSASTAAGKGTAAPTAPNPSCAGNAESRSVGFSYSFVFKATGSFFGILYSESPIGILDLADLMTKLT